MHRRHDEIRLADQQGAVYAYSSASVISTAWAAIRYPVLEHSHGGVRQ